MIGSWPPTIRKTEENRSSHRTKWIPFTKDHRSHRDKPLTGDRCHGKATRDRLSKQGTAHPAKETRDQDT